MMLGKHRIAKDGLLAIGLSLSPMDIGVVFRSNCTDKEPM